MIATLSGVLAEREGEMLVVQTDGGVGYAVTVPLGVLLASPDEEAAIRFTPRLPVLDEARSRLAMGFVTRESAMQAKPAIFV